MAELDTVMKSLDTIDNKIQTVVNDTTASVNAVKAEVKSLGEKQLEACKELAAIQQKLAETKSEATPVDNSLGAQFTRDQSYIELSNNIRHSRNGARVLVKTDSTPTTSVVTTGITRTSLAQPYEVPGIVGGPELPLLVESLIPHVPVSSGSVNYVKGSFTNGAAEVAEGGSKPETTFSMSLATASIQTVAHWTKISEQLAADAPAVTAYINTKMQYGLALKIDRQLVVGDGTSGAISGLLNSGNYTSYTSAISSSLPTDATLIDFALLIKTHLETLGYAPRYLVLNPADWAALALLKDEQGRYLLGGPANATGKQLWGIPVVTTAAVTSGQYLMADFALGATIFDRQEMAIEIDREGTDFTQNLLTIRCERRLGLVVEDAAAIGGGDWALPS